MNLGPIPSDLAEVLADIAIASPAVTASRSVSRYYDSDHYSMALFAFDLASEFFSLFNKPESISAVRLSTGKLHTGGGSCSTVLMVACNRFSMSSSMYSKLTVLQFGRCSTELSNR